MTQVESINTDQQLNLFTKRPVWDQPIFADIQPHIVRMFWKFHTENPHIYELFKSFCQDVKNAGRTAYGAGAVFERIRWHVNIEVRSDDDFKLNNNYRSCYSRLLILEDPSFSAFFAIRSTKEVS